MNEHSQTYNIFIADMHGQSNAFFNYRSEYVLYDFGNEVKKCIISKTQKPEDVAEKVRQ